MGKNTIDKLQKIIDKIYQDIGNCVKKKSNNKKIDLSKCFVKSSDIDEVFKKHLSSKSLSRFDNRVIKTLILLGNMPQTDDKWLHQQFSELSIKIGDGINYETNLEINDDKTVKSITINYK